MQGICIEILCLRLGTNGTSCLPCEAMAHFPTSFTNAGSCWWDNFTKMQLLLHAYFTNAGSCWWVHFTGMQHFLGPYFTIARWETQPIWDNLTTFLIWLYLTVISGLSIASGLGICAWPS